MKLRIADNLTLPIDFVTSTQVVLAQKGKGKSYTAAVEAEELLDASQQIVIVDPTDAHWGLRSSPDGRSTGYPIAVFGGDHGDVALEPDAGVALAEAVVAERFSAIICTENLSGAGELRFVADFLETLYRKNRQAMHLFVDEADLFAPQKPFGGEMRTCGAMDNIVRRGRKKGIGCTLVTQRSSVLNKNVLSQADMLVALGCSHPRDLDAIMEWVRRHADPARAKEMMESLPALPRGEAWVWNPSAEIFKRIAVRARRTFDSGATPKPGQKAAVAKVLAPVDIQRLGEKIAATAQRQRDNDPTALRAKVAKLEKTIADLMATNDTLGKHAAREESRSRQASSKIIEKPVVKDAQIKRIETALARAEKVLAKHDEAVSRHHTAYATALEGYTTNTKAVVSAAQVAVDDLRRALGTAVWASAAPREMPKITPINNGDGTLTWEPATVAHPGHRKINGHGHAEKPEGLRPTHLRILSAIAWWNGIGVEAPDLAGVAFIAGTTSTSSSFDNNRARLRVLGLIEYPESSRVRLTADGRKAAPPSDIPQTTGALHAAVLHKVTPAIGRILNVLIEAYPDDVALSDLAERAGSSASSSSFDNNRSWLRARGLAEYPRTGFARATSLLFPEMS